ncbi:rCG29469, isoform CRA_c [Rattus norvegicus]|uniref:RCG29469, isoform CRA_c n=2 Tax=Rattus norvegicus TaxID=10116 RepID=A6K8F7_RAT|nr:junctional sarcoplasmic reticulum protein 1 [Rattus norvegicus]XP_038935853.1 junctional sarcoplasmic reticulum protein 1 isoform X1 [Rattus norvegicus]EDL89229.1 rCG29469, isoform CRA_c [Rattus norvegicus]|eukprot:NP_001103061.1 junctional sarcoplasmic reticulum protein 1 [Rattus norvegicus]
MTTRGLEDLDGGLGSCIPSDDLPFLEESPSGRRPDSKTRGTSRLSDSSSWSHVLQDPVTAGAGDAGLKKTEKERMGKESAPAGKAGASPRSIPARRKPQAAPPLQPPLPPSDDELPWGDLTLNKCLVLASLLALLGSAFQLCRDAVAGEAVAAPQQWVPPSSPTKKPASPTPAPAPAPKPPVLVPPSGPPQPKPGPPAPQAEMRDEPELPGSPEAAETQAEPGGSISEASGEESAPLGDRGSQEKPQKEKPRKGEKPKKEKPRREKPRREEKPQVTREPRQSLRQRWEAREGGHRPWRRDSRDLEHGKLKAWAPRRRHDQHDRDNRPRQRPRVGKRHD